MIIVDEYVLLPSWKREVKRASVSVAIRFDPNLNPAHNNLGNLLSDEHFKRYDEAEVNYRKAIELNPANDNVYYNLGILLHEKFKRYDEAEVNYRKAIEINPSFRGAYYNLACLKSITNSIESAFEYLETASKLDGFDPAWAWEDSDLENIRNDPRFIEIVGAKPEE